MNTPIMKSGLVITWVAIDAITPYENNPRKDDVVLDLFGGSGTTLIACEEMERQCRMMEFDPIYCQVIINRWEALTGKTAEKVC